MTDNIRAYKIGDLAIIKDPSDRVHNVLDRILEQNAEILAINGHIVDSVLSYTFIKNMENTEDETDNSDS